MFWRREKPTGEALSVSMDELEWAQRGAGRARSLLGEARAAFQGRRLAYVDSCFPWTRNELRYADALALLSERPDTVFFSTHAVQDEFPKAVYPLASFPRLASSLGITDVYGVSLDFMSDVLGLGSPRVVDPRPTAGPDLSAVFGRMGIRTHVGLYPDVALPAGRAGYDTLEALVGAADSVLSWSTDVAGRFPEVALVTPGIIDTSQYRITRHDFRAQPLQLLFVADAGTRDGLDVALGAMTLLEREAMHLHVVGSQDPASWTGDSGRVTFHGPLDPSSIRELHRLCQVFISPTRAEADDTDGIVTDGFPTTAAGEAISSGCLLVSSNPTGDHRALRPGLDYLEVAPDPHAAAGCLRDVLSSPEHAAEVARRGAHRVRQRLDMRVGCADRLRSMRLDDPIPATFFSRSVPRLSGALTQISVRRTSRLAARWPGDLAHLRAELSSLRGEIESIGLSSARQAGVTLAELAQLEGQVAALSRQLAGVGRAAIEDLSGVRKALAELRCEPEYSRAFADPNPLVTVCIPTYTNLAGLMERSLPSVLAQSYERLEVIVVGDAAPPETSEALAKMADPRVRFENLTVRGPYPEDRRERWLVAGTGPLNTSIERATGAWLVIHNDDDVMRAAHVQSLLDHARSQQTEVAYGKFEFHSRDGGVRQLGRFPPEFAAFGWQAAITHAQVAKLFTYELSAYIFDEPGDWNRARRMLQAGVSFAMLDEVVFDYYPSDEWQTT